MRFAFLRRPLFLLLFAVPNLISLLYFGIIASPVYTSRASLTVLNPTQNASNLTSLLSGGSGDGSSQGAYILKEYLGSWEEFRKIDRSVDLGRKYALGDLVSRYGGLATWFRTDDVALWRYYKKNVDVTVDLKSGIASVETYGYRPDFSYALAKALLDDAVGHMNAMNHKQEQDYIGNAETKRAELEKAVREDEAALARYRSESGLYDPKEQYLSDLSLANGLAMRDAEFKSQYDSVAKATPNSPEAQNLDAARTAIRSKIADVKGKVAVTARASARYEELIAHRDNDMTLLQQANIAVQDAHQKAVQNRYYLNIISQPSQPETPELPHRLWWIGGIFLATLVLWGLLR